MENWSEIIKQISVKQRVLALFLILLFPVISFLGGKYLDNNSCREFIDENKNLHKDLAQISRLIREYEVNKILTYNENQTSQRKSTFGTPSSDSLHIKEMRLPINEPILDSILMISEKY